MRPLRNIIRTMTTLVGEQSITVSEANEIVEFERPIQKNGRFDNPKSFENWTGAKGIGDVIEWRFKEKDHENVPKDMKVLDKTIPVHNLTSFEPSRPSNLFATWLGHATVLVNMEGVDFITDPVWSERASFTQLSGPNRYRPPPMEITNLPELSFGVISHDHYDHLDAAAVKKISSLQPSMQWFVPLKMLDWMKSIEVENTEEFPNKVTEMNWGDHKSISIDGKDFVVWCLPAQHWGRRGPLDTNKRLWCGWAVVGPSKRFYYSGDTGFCDKEFKKIGDKLGPFDLAAIPIGAYEPRWFMKSMHINPEDAVELHKLIRSKLSIGIHWGTYHMGTYEYYLEPKQKLAQLMSENPDANPFKTIEMGEIWEETNGYIEKSGTENQ